MCGKRIRACFEPRDESTLTPEMTEQMLGKCEVLAKFYKKKHATGITAIGYCPRKYYYWSQRIFYLRTNKK